MFYEQCFTETRWKLNYISFEKEDILKIIRNLNVNNAHGCDDILKIHDINAKNTWFWRRWTPITYL